MFEATDKLNRKIREKSKHFAGKKSNIARTGSKTIRPGVEEKPDDEIKNGADNIFAERIPLSLSQEVARFDKIRKGRKEERPHRQRTHEAEEGNV